MPRKGVAPSRDVIPQAPRACVSTVPPPGHLKGRMMLRIYFVINGYDGILLLAFPYKIGRGCRLRSRGFMLPKHALYWTELNPDEIWYLRRDLNPQGITPAWF